MGKAKAADKKPKASTKARVKTAKKPVAAAKKAKVPAAAKSGKIIPFPEVKLVSEEDVKFKFLVPYLEQLGYKAECIAFNVPVNVQEGRKKKTIFADAIVYATKTHKSPLLVCETKAPTEILDKAAREQAISYARLLPKIAPLVVLTNGYQVQVYHTVHKTRRNELPARPDLDTDILKFVLDVDAQSALREEAKHDLFIIDDVRTFKNILKACHSEIRNNEGLDPTAAFDEMSKIMFTKLFEEKENPQGNRFRTAVFDDSLERMKLNVVRKIFEEAKAHPLYKGLFEAHSAINLKDRTIRKIVTLFENYDLGLTAFDVKGEAFEYFLGDTFTGGLGEYFTPRNVVEFMVEAVDPKIGEKIIDPFCGTGGFMIFAFEVVSEKIRLQEFSAEEKAKWKFDLSSKCLFGTDWKERTSQACKMNMMVHGDGSSGVFMHDGFTDVDGHIAPGMFNLCLTNPPFGSFETDPAVLKRYELGGGRNSQDRVILAVERALQLVKPGGRIAIVVIDGVLNNQRNAYVRDFIRRNARIQGVVSLNAETFEGYGARAKTSILFLEKKETPNDDAPVPVFMSIARNTGLAANGEQIAGNVLPDVLLDWKEYRRNGKTAGLSESWIVTDLKDRLDAEFYAQSGTKTEGDLLGSRKKISDTRQKIADAEAALAKAEEVFGSVKLQSKSIGDLLEEVGKSETLAADTMYTLLGVRWWGEGVFVREQKRGKEIKARSLVRVETDAVIYNRLFAFRGSFAVTQKEHEGSFVSSEFPMFLPKSDLPKRHRVALVQYIAHLLNSPQYLAVVDKQSTGSTKQSRNRFNQKLFLQLPVHVPKDAEDLSKLVDLLQTTDELRTLQTELAEAVKEMRQGVQALLPQPV